MPAGPALLNTMKRLASIGAAALFLLLAALTLRAISFTSRQLKAPPTPALAVHRDAAVKRLSRAIQYRTVSTQGVSPSTADFSPFNEFLTASFPKLHARLARETVGAHSLLYTWKGKNGALKPMLLMAHLDVVPVDPLTESSWTHPPFSGAVAGGYIWGRGTMDDKAAVMAILEAVEHLLGEGYEPERTVYLAFGHDEEIGGESGAAKIAERLRSRGVELEYVIDEGLNIFPGVIPGVDGPVALIGVAEKGYLSLQLTVQTAGGHSSTPPRRTAIGVMSRALQRLQAAPFPSRLIAPTREMLEFLGPEMSWDRTLVLANLWLFDPIVRRQLAASPLTDAAIRTTIAPTYFNAGIKENVLPNKAAAIINLRLLPGDTIAGAIAHVRAAIDDATVNIAALPVQSEASAVSNIDSASFGLIAPALLVAATDSRHYRALTADIYRFLPITVGPEDAKRYHGIDERISLDDYERCIRFYAQLIRNSQA
jgi:carboxypeptidase PM20D1